MAGFEKRRPPARPGSIPAVLDMFSNEVRFYREIAPVVGVRVPACDVAQIADDGSTYLVLEDLSDWAPGGDPIAVARVLRALHERWESRAVEQWPWLRRSGLGAELIADLFDRVWSDLRGRSDLTSRVCALGDGLVGTIVNAEQAEGTLPMTLCHGDASLRNVFTSADGSVALVDWEDVRLANGTVDLAWLLVSSVAPPQWDAVVNAYGPAPALDAVLPSAAAQGLLSLSDHAPRSPDAQRWLRRLEEAASRLA
jgi:thiamine kinase-like enzyme